MAARSPMIARFMTAPTTSTLPGAPISLAYSVDADDAFMFHAVREGLIDLGGLTFSHQRADTAALNRLALAGRPGVGAILARGLPAAASRHQLLPHGAAGGARFGPVAVASRRLVAGAA